MAVCKHCGVTFEEPKNRRVCYKCKYKLSSIAKKRAANPQRKKKIDVEPRLQGFYVNTPHQISRNNIKDKFNGWY